MQPPVILVIPASDEAESIGAVRSEVPPEVVVVVGSSTDPTAAVAAAHGARIIAQSRPGYGAACWEGAREAAALGAEVVVFLDGDYTDPPMELAQVLGPVLADEADLVLGCRDVAAHPDALPLHARLGNSLMLTSLRVLLGGSRFCDLPSFKAIRVEVLETLKMREMTHGWTVEMVVKAARADLRIAQVSINYRPRLAGRSEVSGVIREAFAALTKGADVALGPAEDGGYYLLAARGVHPSLFYHMPWSTSGVASETLRRCRALGLRTHMLPAWYDIDDAASLASLRRDLRRLPMSTGPQTRAALEALDSVAMPPGRAA